MPIVCYNYTKTVSEFELGLFMGKGYPCNCQNYPFVSEYRGHVVTGNRSVVFIGALKGLISKGPQFREQNKIAWGKDQKIILEAVEDHAKS